MRKLEGSAPIVTVAAVAQHQTTLRWMGQGDPGLIIAAAPHTASNHMIHCMIVFQEYFVKMTQQRNCVMTKVLGKCSD